MFKFDNISEFQIEKSKEMCEKFLNPLIEKGYKFEQVLDNIDRDFTVILTDSFDLNEKFIIDLNKFNKDILTIKFSYYPDLNYSYEKTKKSHRDKSFTGENDYNKHLHSLDWNYSVNFVGIGEEKSYEDYSFDLFFEDFKNIFNYGLESELEDFVNKIANSYIIEKDIKKNYHDLLKFVRVFKNKIIKGGMDYKRK